MIKILFLLSVSHIVHRGAAIWTDTFAGVCGGSRQEQELAAPPDNWEALTKYSTISETLSSADPNYPNTVGCFTSDYYPG
jgi:hypothetical protein